MPGAGGPSPAPGFGARLAAAVAARESQIVLGIDPDPARLWPGPLARTSEARAALAQALAGAHESARGVIIPAARHPGGTDGAAAADEGVASLQLHPAALEAAAAVLAHSLALIGAAAGACVAAKPQLACFERLGFAGALALEAVIAQARAAGLLVIADGKRGDVPVTATAYAQALTGRTPSPFGPVPGLGVDALTANPLLGRDALDPLVDGARAAGAGVFVLVRTSNPGAADVMDLRLESGEPLWEQLAVTVDGLGRGGALKDIGAVTGATAPQHLARMRELMPSTPFLLPGVGAQGGDVATLAPVFAPGRAAGLITASRSIAHAHEQTGTDPASAARSEAERLRELAWKLA